MARRWIEAGRARLRPQRWETGLPLYGYTRELRTPVRGRALISYLPDPVRDRLAGRHEAQFSNRGIARALPRALNELGFAVDVVSWDDTEFAVNESYDVLVQHGGINFDHLHAQLSPDTRTVYFSSGAYWRVHNQRAEERAAAFERRHGVRLEPERQIKAPEERATRLADGVIAIGSASIVSTYKDFELVLPLDLAAYPDARADARAKDMASARNRAVFHAGGGNLHKGLDLVLEAFADLDMELYVVTHLQPEFVAVYQPEIAAQSNIHLVGMVGHRSREFYEIMDACAYAILPSCSEGQPGSVVETMGQGLIPIVSAESNLDTADFGVTLGAASIEEIRSAVTGLRDLADDELTARSAAARHAARTRHAPDVFLDSLKRHLATVLG